MALQGPLPDVVGTHHIKPDGPTLMHIEIEDDDEAMIIDHFESSSNFILDCIHQNGSIAVICAQGVSRSVTLVLAYMMRYHYDSPRRASACLEDVRQRYPDACPNDGFMQQLDTWYDMNFRYDLTHETYRSLCALKTARIVRSQGDSFDIGALQDPRECITESSSKISYRCRSCGTILATSDNIMVDVSVGQGKDGFSWRKRAKDALHAQTSTSCGHTLYGEAISGSIFVEPLRWMDGITDNTQGKIYCPSCSARLGSYNWAGMQNEASEWITPAFQLHLSKIDIMNPRDNGCDMNSGHASMPAIRQPKLLGSKPRASVNPTALPSNNNNNTRRQYLIFDCDGVLVDSERASCEALRRAIYEVTGFDIPHCFPHDFVPVFGMDVRSCLEYYMDTYKSAEEMCRKACDDTTFVDWIQDLADKVSHAKTIHYESITSMGIDPIPGARSLMKNACLTCVHPETRAPLVAIASSGSHAKIRHNLSSAGLWGIIEPYNIVSAEEVQRGKPHPDVYVKTLEKLCCRTPIDDAIVIEDSIHGIHAAALAGVGRIAAVTTSLSHMEMHNALLSLRNTIGQCTDHTSSQGASSGCSGTDSKPSIVGAGPEISVPPLRVRITSQCTVSIIGSTLPSTFEQLVHLVWRGEATS